VQIGGSRYVNTNRAPTGWVDVFNEQKLAGWAFDPNAGPGPIQIRYTLDNNAPVLAAADVTRPDLVAALGSSDHGFNITLPQLTAGPHVVRVFTVDSTSRQLKLLGERRITVTSPPGNALPIGNLDVATIGRGAGWLWDPSSPNDSLMLRLDVDGTPGTPFTANKSRPDVNKFVNAAGVFGFDMPLTLTPGQHRVELLAMDAESGTPVLIDSAIVTSPPPAGQKAAAGVIDVANSAQIIGWAWNSAVDGLPVALRVDINNVPVTVTVTTISRPDVAAIYGPGDFGFSISTPALPKGTHKISLYVLDPMTLNPTLVAVRNMIVA
jgi:hypothetical protein